jgi:hypothetical protein
MTLTDHVLWFTGAAFWAVAALLFAVEFVTRCVVHFAKRARMLNDFIKYIREKNRGVKG